MNLAKFVEYMHCQLVHRFWLVEFFNIDPICSKFWDLCIAVVGFLDTDGQFVKVQKVSLKTNSIID